MNIIEILQEMRIEYKEHGEHHHTTSGWISIDCPHCSPDSEQYRLGINLQGLYCNCWYCGSHNLKTSLLVAAGANVTRESRGLLSELSKEYAQTDSKPWLKRQLVLPIGIVDLQTAHLKYLRSRGFNPQKIKKLWGVQGFCVHKDLSWRLFIPIEYKGEVVSWTTRSLGENRRYISASEYQERIPHKELLYGEHYVRNSVVVLEGITDVWKVGPGAVALFGTGFKRSQVLKISKYPKRVICFDSEKKAQEKAEELACMLQSFPGETIVVQLQTGKDPCSASDKEVKQLRSFLK